MLIKLQTDMNMEMDPSLCKCHDYNGLQVGGDIDGEAAGDNFGWFLYLSMMVKQVIIGATD